MMKLLLATQNQGKLKEMQEILKDLPIEVITPSEDFDVEETGTTFEENSLLKAKAFSEKYDGILTLADDSGLVVDALDGRPGVYSKRYGTDDLDRNTKLLKELEDKADRTAHFLCVMCLFGKDVNRSVEGRVTGQIGLEMKGNQGFGYDPIFIPDGFDKTFAELSSEEKNQISHRGRAMDKVRNILEEMVNDR